MIDNQYRIPNQPDEAQSKLDDFLQAQQESLQEEPEEQSNEEYINYLSMPESIRRAREERAPIPEYLEERRIELAIEMMRQQATPEMVARYELGQLFGRLSRLVSTPSNETITKKIMDIESEIGGRSLPLGEGMKSQRFWFDHNGHWFYEAVYEDQPNVPYIAHYAITEQVMTKSSNGRVIAFAPGEAESLFYRIQTYFDAIQDSFYGHYVAPTSEDAANGSRNDYGLAA